MRTALVVCPTARDRVELADPRIGERFALLLSGPPPGPGFDPAAYVERISRRPPAVDGVFAARDASAHVAAVLAGRLGLPGLGAEAFMRCHDKLACRRTQASVVPEATPAFAALDPWSPPAAGKPPLPYPFFAKPIVAHLSQLAARVDGDGELAALLARARSELPAITAHDRALAGGRHELMLAEEALGGRQITYEGFVHRGAVHHVGITDSVMHRNGISFLRFQYPTALPRADAAAVEAIAERLAPALGLEETLFNVELFVREGEPPAIVEVNPRLASQFSPLVRAVHGVSTYELQLELATGGSPALPPADPEIAAASFVVRVYEDAVVRRVPDPAALCERFPDARVELLVRPGQLLSENDDDMLSYRLAVVALAARGRERLYERYRELVRALDFELEPPLPYGEDQ